MTESIDKISTPQECGDLETLLDVPTIDDGPRFASVGHIGPWLPEADPACSQASRLKSLLSRRQAVLWGCSVLALLTFLINASAIIYFRLRYGTNGDLGMIYHGHRSQSHRISSSLHVIINALGTILFGVSNLCMQLLAAPTRQEIDEAHKRHIWLDIGVPSFRNLKYISGWRTTGVILLAISSIPLHFV